MYDGPGVERDNESNQRSESASSEKPVDDSKKASGEVLRTPAEQTAIYNTYIEQELGFSPVAESSGLGSWLSFFDTNDIKREQFRALENLTLQEVRKIVLETNPAERLQEFKAIGVDPNSFDVVYQSLRDDKSLDEAQTIGDILKARAVRLATSDPGKG